MVALFICIIGYHELAHLLVTEYYGVTQSLCLVRKRDGLGKYFFFGAGVKYDNDQLTQRQKHTVMLAPLALLPVSGVFYFIGMYTGFAIFFIAGIMTVFSDVLMMVFDVESADKYHVYELVNFEDEKPTFGVRA